MADRSTTGCLSVEWLDGFMAGYMAGWMARRNDGGWPNEWMTG